MGLGTLEFVGLDMFADDVVTLESECVVGVNVVSCIVCWYDQDNVERKERKRVGKMLMVKAVRSSCDIESFAGLCCASIIEDRGFGSASSSPVVFT
jgi:hypothetical protein